MFATYIIEYMSYFLLNSYEKILRKELLLNGAISTVVHIRLRRVLENCLYIDGWCAPGVHTGTRAHRRFKPVFN